MSIIETRIEIPKPPERGVLVIEKPLSMEEAARLRELLMEAKRENRWPVVLSGVGAVYWLDQAGTS